MVRAVEEVAWHALIRRHLGTCQRHPSQGFLAITCGHPCFTLCVISTQCPACSAMPVLCRYCAGPQDVARMAVPIPASLWTDSK